MIITIRSRKSDKLQQNLDIEAVLVISYRPQARTEETGLLVTAIVF